MSHHAAPRLRPDPIAVLHAAVESSPQGIKGAATAIGRSPGVLYNKFSESMPHNDITVREAVAITRAIGGHAFVDALCAEFGGVFIPLPEGEAADDDVLSASLEVVSKVGDLAHELMTARADGLIDHEECAALERRAYQAIRAVHVLLLEVRSQARPAVLPILPPVSKGRAA